MIICPPFTVRKAILGRNPSQRNPTRRPPVPPPQQGEDLPPGWQVATRPNNRGAASRCYLHPLSGVFVRERPLLDKIVRLLTVANKDYATSSHQIAAVRTAYRLATNKIWRRRPAAPAPAAPPDVRPAVPRAAAAGSRRVVHLPPARGAPVAAPPRGARRSSLLRSLGGPVPSGWRHELHLHNGVRRECFLHSGSGICVFDGGEMGRILAALGNGSQGTLEIKRAYRAALGRNWKKPRTFYLESYVRQVDGSDVLVKMPGGPSIEDFTKNRHPSLAQRIQEMERRR